MQRLSADEGRRGERRVQGEVAWRDTLLEMPARPEGASAACLGDDTVALFLDGRLTGDEETRLRGHVDTCAECRGLLADAGRTSGRHTEPNPVLQPGAIVAGKYRIEGLLGAGGMGTVYRAVHLVLGRTVALKMMHAELLSTDHARRFEREARAAASLTSENAVRIADIDRAPDGTPYIVMEHLEGQDLYEMLLAAGSLPWERAVRYVLEAADAVGEAHARGIVHRDLKPHNVFLTRGDVIKVLDFGLAKLVGVAGAVATAPSSTGVKSGRLMGSPLYMAPEQIRAAHTVDARTDLYALGATLYHLIAGVPPFSGVNVYVLCARILNEAPASLARARKNVPGSIDRFVLRCLEKDPSDRHGSIEEWAAALREAVAAAGDVEPTRSRSVAASSAARAMTTSAASTLREHDLDTVRDATLRSPEPVFPSTTERRPRR